jgi:hypothetical protein
VNPFLDDLLAHLRASGFRDLAGTSLVLDMPLTDIWLNEVIAAWIAQASGPVKAARLSTVGGNRADLQLRLAKLAFVPLTVHLFIERQPEIPSSPVLVIRWETVNAGLTALASRALNFTRDLPQGIAMAGDRIGIDLFALLQGRGVEWLLPLIHRVLLTTEPGRLLLHITLAAPPPQS